MARRLDIGRNWKYHLDTKATNTAENFAYFRQWVEKEDAGEIYIATSSFHHQRALSIVKGILVNLRYNWLLGNLGYPNCKNDERVHSKNIHIDIKNAINMYEALN